MRVLAEPTCSPEGITGIRNYVRQPLPAYKT